MPGVPSCGKDHAEGVLGSADICHFREQLRRQFYLPVVFVFAGHKNMSRYVKIGLSRFELVPIAEVVGNLAKELQIIVSFPEIRAESCHHLSVLRLST